MRRRRPVHVLEVGLTLPLETFLADKLDGLVSRGFEVTVSAAGDGGAPAAVGAVKLVPAPPPGESRAALLLAILKDALRLAVRRPGALAATIRAARHPILEAAGNQLLQSLARLRSYLPLAALDPDIVHFEWPTGAIDLLPMASVWRCPTVVSCRGSNVNVLPHAPGSAPFRRALREVFERVDATHCVSEAIAAEAAALGMDPRRAWLIRPGVDTSFFSAAAGEARPDALPASLRILSIGDLRWLKGHEYSVRAVALLRAQGVAAELEIVGADPSAAVGEASDASRILAAISRTGVGDHVKLLGRLSRVEVRGRLRAC
ncbi:MAG TPA: glycosyltransferase, partial [Solirubrobacteraceae bacterium]|nr:glycosyltransferase [Solirubrobacteraceae bacterium]